METSTTKVVTVGIDMSLEELRTIRQMLHDWNRELGQRLPQGPTPEQTLIIDEIDSIYVQAVQ